MKSLVILLMAVMAVGLSGCGKGIFGGSDAEETTEADTANLETSENAEALPGEEAPADAAPAVADETTPPPAGEPVGEVPPIPADVAAETPPADTSTPSVSGTGEMVSYAVQSGDTLMKIAFNLYGDINKWQDIYDWNKDKLSSANALTAGMELKYDKPASEPVIERNGDPYLIKKGDTLGTIAYDIYAKQSKWRKLYENNRTLIKDPNKIYAGFYLYYQITEAEKQEAEAIRGSKGAEPQHLGSASAPAPVPVDAGAVPADAPVDMGAAMAAPVVDGVVAPPADMPVESRTPGSVQ